MSFTVRPMLESDCPGVAKIQEEAFPQDLAAFTEVQLKEELVRSWARLWVCVDHAGLVCGVLIVWHVVDEIHLLNIATMQSHARQGVASLLIDELDQYAAKERAVRIFLEVKEQNEPAVRLYEKRGYAVFGKRLNYYSDGATALEMTRALESA